MILANFSYFLLYVTAYLELFYINTKRDNFALVLKCLQKGRVFYMLGSGNNYFVSLF